MIGPRDALFSIIRPALKALPEAMDSLAARVLLVAIGLQESGFKNRIQMVGPARGFWQFEPNGVRAVLVHPKTENLAARCALDAHRIPSVDSVYRALAVNDTLACQFARLLLFADELPLPTPDDSAGAWAYYIRNWEPGRPRTDAWKANHDAAVAAVMPPSMAPEETVA